MLLFTKSECALLNGTYLAEFETPPPADLTERDPILYVRFDKSRTCEVVGSDVLMNRAWQRFTFLSSTVYFRFCDTTAARS